jgi:hypothetical protein
VTTDLIPHDAVRYDDLQNVIELYVQNINATQISKQLGLQRKYVVELLDEFKASARYNTDMKDRVAEAIRVMDEHFGFLIREAHKTLSQVDEEIANNGVDHQLLAQRSKAISVLMDLQSRRIDTMQKAGLLDAAELGNEVAEIERKQEILVEILREHLCPMCKKAVMSRLGAVTGRAEVVVVHEN